MSVGIGLGGADRASIRLLVEWPDGLFVAPNDPRTWQELCDRNFLNGAIIARDLNEQYFVARVRSYAQIDSMLQARLWHAVVRGECHDGEFVSIADAASWLKLFREMTPEQYERRVFGRDHGFPPYSITCQCRFEALIPGADDYHQLNSERKIWKWFRRFRRRQA